MSSSPAYKDALRRIRELEQLNSLLAEQIDRQRPVIEAARALRDSGSSARIDAAIERVVTNVMAYDKLMAQLNKGERE